MKTLKELKKMYIYAKSSKYISVQLDFIEAIASSNDYESIKYHYELLNDQTDTRLFQYLRGAFKKHGDAGKSFLLNALKNEKDQNLRAEALFILGLMKCKKSKLFTIELLNKDNYTYRYYGIIVLGWIGDKDEIPSIEHILISDNNAELRAHSASALRQIWYNHPEQKNRILSIYYNALINEKNDEVNSTIVACIQDMLRKKFGIKENKEGIISGDIICAKQRALDVLSVHIVQQE